MRARTRRRSTSWWRRPAPSSTPMRCAPSVPVTPEGDRSHTGRFWRTPGRGLPRGSAAGWARRKPQRRTSWLRPARPRPWAAPHWARWWDFRRTLPERSRTVRHRPRHQGLGQAPERTGGASRLGPSRTDAAVAETTTLRPDAALPPCLASYPRGGTASPTLAYRRSILLSVLPTRPPHPTRAATTAKATGTATGTGNGRARARATAARTKRLTQSSPHRSAPRTTPTRTPGAPRALQHRSASPPSLSPPRPRPRVPGTGKGTGTVREGQGQGQGKTTARATVKAKGNGQGNGGQGNGNGLGQGLGNGQGQGQGNGQGNGQGLGGQGQGNGQGAARGSAAKVTATAAAPDSR